MSDVLGRLGDGEFHSFESLFNPEEGRRGVVVTFLAMLELAKETLIEIVQNEVPGPIYIKALIVDGETPTLAADGDESADVLEAS